MSLWSECWIWTGGVNNSGYGPHRQVYERMRGAVAPGLQLDHLCRVRRCLNPAHMEPVTAKENNSRSDSPSAHHARKTHCPVGHPYSGTNVRGERICNLCAGPGVRAAYRRRRAARGLSVGPPNSAKTECHLGHPLTVFNEKGWRKCKVCHRDYERRRRAEARS